MPGLTSQEVSSRIEQGLINEAVDTSTRSVKEIVKENVFTYFNLVFTILAVLLILVGSFKDLSFVLILVFNSGVGIFQEIQSKNTLDALKFQSATECTAIRDGTEVLVPTEQLVLGDVIRLNAGDQVPADGELISGSASVNESLLTGEADEIEKSEGDELRSGSYLISGSCLVRLTAVGRDSYISKLTIEATKQKKNEQSQMVRSLDKLVKVIGIIIIPIGVILMVQQIVIQNNSFSDSVISMVAAVLGMIPEGLYMMASIAMAVSAARLAQNSVLVQNMRCIETLARVDVLCVDKTGTITESKMHVDDFVSAVKGYSEDEIAPLVADLALSQNRDNETMAAMQAYFTEGTGRTPYQICPFSSAYKYCGACFEDGNYVLGAPDVVLGENFGRYSRAVRSAASQGYRVLAFGVTESTPDGSPLGYTELLAFILLTNSIREGAEETFGFFAENGVEIKVISGDDPATASSVAAKAGIPSAEKYVDARSLSDSEIDRAVAEYTVFGRVTPDQKRLFVKSLQKQGKTVGMTGDGVNDILALRDADISIAMASGSEAASKAAELVLVDSDFSKMPMVVAEGRRVVNNIIKTATLYLTKNIFSVLLALFSVINVIQYPLQPSQITLISIFTIGLPSFVLSLEPNSRKIKGSFLGNVFRMATPAGITLFISVSALLAFGQVLKLDTSSISTSCSALVALVEFLILARVAQPMNRLHLSMMVIMVAGFLFMIVFHSEFFGISPLNWTCVLLLAVFLIATEALFRYFYKFTTFIGRTFGREAREARRAEKNK